MFPHTVTIFNITKDNSGVYFNRKIVKDVFYYRQKLISQENKGDKYTYSYHCIFSSKALNDYLDNAEYKLLENKTNNYTVKENDIVVLNECDDIKDISELQNSSKEWFYIRSITDSRYGSNILQNMEVTN